MNDQPEPFLTPRPRIVDAPPITPAPPPPAQPTVVKPSKRPILIGIGIFVVLLVIVGFLSVQYQNQQGRTVGPTPYPTPLPSPTPVQNRSAISTTSAFRAYHEAVASFSATINSFSIQDGTLTPPTLELELGL